MHNLNFTSNEYLPDSAERIERLRKIVNGRPVAILAAGPSIKELEDRIGELRDADICYFGFNNFFVQEKKILAKINRHMDVTMGTCREAIPEAIGAILEFLNRKENNLFVSSFWRDTFGLLGKDFDLKNFLDIHDKKLLFTSLARGKAVPSSDRPLHFVESNSLLLMIQIALIGGASSIVLFGADGHCGENAKESYYNQKEYQPNLPPMANLYLIQDTRVYFNPIARLAIENTCRTYNIPLINILNCSVKSFYVPFPKVTYDEAFEYLITGKKVIGKLDLRVPKQPKVSNPYLLAVEKTVNFLSKHRWRSFGIICLRVWQKFENKRSVAALNKRKNAKQP